MKMFYIIFGIFILTFVIIWIIGFYFANDLNVPSKKFISNSSNESVLIIFPHADDEALSMGGYISKLSKNGASINLVILTRGEKGNDLGTYDESLKEIRTQEAQKVAKIFGVTKLIQKDFPDGNIESHRDELEKYIIKLIKESKPNQIVTYDLAGLYGHPDHIVTSEVISELVASKYKDIKLVYVSMPKKLLDLVTLPEHMAIDKKFSDKRVYPTSKVWVGIGGIIKKTQAVYIYKSQRESYKKSFLYRFIPFWFYISLTPYEYFHEKK